MRAALAYRPTGGRLQRAGAGAAVAYLGSIAVAAFVLQGPLMLAGLAAAVGVAAVLSGAGRAVRASLALAVPLALLYTLLTALIAQRGETVLLRGWDLAWPGRLDVTLEALVAGGVIGARIVIVVACFAIWSRCVDPDRVLRALRPVASRSALTASLAVRLVPVAVSDAASLREAASLRGPGAAPVGRAALVRRIVAGSLDRAVDVAATLELRGYGLGPGRMRSASLLRGSPHDPSLVLAGVAIAGVAVFVETAGMAGFTAYPTLQVVAGPPALLAALLLPLLASIPFLRPGRLGVGAYGGAGLAPSRRRRETPGA